jgi:hypothetical protein
LAAPAGYAAAVKPMEATELKKLRRDDGMAW